MPFQPLHFNKTMSNNTDSDRDPPSTDEGNVKLGFYIASLILGFGGNSLVITVMSRKKQKRSIPRLFILNLAISDLSFILIATPRCTNKHLLLHQHNLPKLVLLSTFNTSGDNNLFREYLYHLFHGGASL